MDETIIAEQEETEEIIETETTEDPADGEETSDTTEDLEGAAPSTDDGEEGLEEKNKSKKKTGFQKAIDKQRLLRSKAQQEAAYFKGKCEAMETMKISGGNTSMTPTPEKSPPKESDYDSIEEYREAAIEYKAGQIAAEKIADALKERREAERLSREAQQAADIQTKKQEALKKYEDFDAIVTPTMPLTKTMFEAAKGAHVMDILYHLGSDPDEALRICGLSDIQQAKEIALIEANMKKQTTKIPRQSSTAPDPVKTVKTGSGGKMPINLEKANASDYAAMRRKQELEKKRRVAG
jgi:hypothetical protein